MLYNNTTLKHVVRVNNFKRLLSVKVMGDESAFNNVHKVINNNNIHNDYSNNNDNNNNT